MSDSKRSVPYIHLAWRNAFRNLRRTLLTATAVLVAVMAIVFGVSYISGALTNLLDTYARTESGHVRVRKAGYTARERSLPMHLNLPDLSALLAEIRNTPHVKTAIPRIRSSVLVDDAVSSQAGLFLGVDLEGEEGYLNPVDMLSEGDMPVAGKAEVMIGRGFAEKLNVQVGDTLTLLGQTAYRSLGGLSVKITGIAETGLAAFDSRLILAPIDQVQLMVDLPNATTEILVFAEDAVYADSLAATLQSSLDPMVNGGVEALSWRDQGIILSLIDTAKSMYAVVLLILLLMAGLIIVNTMLMTIMERTREFGMLAALGMRRRNIVGLVLVEGLVIGCIGALVGALLGSGIALWLEHTGIDLTAATKDVDFPIQGIIYPDWRFLPTLASALLGLLVAGFAALYPAWRAVRKTPAEAIRG